MQTAAPWQSRGGALFKLGMLMYTIFQPLCAGVSSACQGPPGHQLGHSDCHDRRAGERHRGQRPGCRDFLSPPSRLHPPSTASSSPHCRSTLSLEDHNSNLNDLVMIASARGSHSFVGGRGRTCLPVDLGIVRGRRREETQASRGRSRDEVSASAYERTLTVTI